MASKPSLVVAEADVHAELFGRLLLRLSSSRSGQARRKLSLYSDRGIPGRQFWCRVACKPPVRLHSWGGSARPDLVVGQKIGDPSHPPDGSPTGTWPLLWVCEIKCESLESLAYDRTKVRRLLKENPAMEGMCLELNLTSGQAGTPVGGIRTDGTGRPEEESVGPCLCEAPMRLDHELRPVDGHLGDLALGEVRNVGSRRIYSPGKDDSTWSAAPAADTASSRGSVRAGGSIARGVGSSTPSGSTHVGSRGRWGGS